MLFDFLSNWTQAIGLLAFGLASGAAFRASSAIRRRAQPLASRWRWIGMVQLVFFFEIVIGTRHMAHDFVNLSLQTAGIYHDRAWIQEVLLMGVALCSLFVVVQLWRWLSHDGARDMPEKIAVVCTAFTLLIFSVETISLHGIDRLLYRPVGPVLFVACLWGAAAVGVFLPALWAARRANRLILVASRSPG